MHALLKIYNHPGYERKIAPAINYLHMMSSIRNLRYYIEAMTELHLKDIAENHREK